VSTLQRTEIENQERTLKKKIQIETEGRRRREESEAFSSGEVLRARVR